MKNPNVVISSDYGPIIININDSVIGKRISQKGYWAVEDIGLMKQLIGAQLAKHETVTVYDVGANIGTHSLALAKSFPEKVKVRSFEAQRQIFNMLCGTMAINGLSNVHCHNNAVGAADGEALEISLLDYNSHNNFGALELLPPKRSDQQDVVKTAKEKVTTLSLDSLDEKVDFIKIDVEGMEDKVLMGAERTIRTHRPILFIEIHKTDAQFALDFFKRIDGYAAFLRGIDLIMIPFEYQLQVNHTQRLM